ncbi:hypothetical protein PF005_g11372 [Phytophthora fragariae]|uniref:Uncharacterized protein n=1 Tax=Phytophthora fragariae TaxID=53985 RepID=A0A6A3XYN8_9STRA|nr:hypothetical protein PF003_g26695 [Phytophthora fragariae]KAE8941185.1 hypothetical protein PF009_g9026 [Phytophthora fragariae]KAE9022659.1 hypothetical protein PF011_g4356 [Phytophthora fragariae]KAE9081601.1 hypothetical protein PF006_g27080 [Phytophthora fragariae]KAE9118385.1 hypothetical protein PF007_g8954 [Phytophthora fragariae]
MVEFGLNNAVHASNGLTLFYVNYGHHIRVSELLGMERSISQDDDENETKPVALRQLAIRVVRELAALTPPCSTASQLSTEPETQLDECVACHHEGSTIKHIFLDKSDADQPTSTSSCN